MLRVKGEGMRVLVQKMGELRHVIGTFDVEVLASGQCIAQTTHKEVRTGPRPKFGQVKGFDLKSWIDVKNRTPGKYHGLRARVGAGVSLSVKCSNFILENPDEHVTQGFIRNRGPLPEPGNYIPVGPYRSLDAPGTQEWDTNNGVAEGEDFGWEALKELAEIAMKLRDGSGYLYYRLNGFLSRYYGEFDRECEEEWRRLDPKRFFAKRAPFVGQVEISPLWLPNSDKLDGMPCLFTPELGSDAVEFVLLLETCLLYYVILLDSEWRPGEGNKKILLHRPYCAMLPRYDDENVLTNSFLAFLSPRGGISSQFGGGAKIVTKDDIRERCNSKSHGICDLLNILPKFNN